MLLDVSRAQLLIVDVQERLLPAMYDGEAMVDRCTVLLQAAAELNIPAIMSEQYRKGLGATVERLLAFKGDTPIFEKMHFSCASDPGIAPHVMAGATQGRRQIVIAGIEAHICVLQSALGFHAMGLDVFVVADATTSRKPDSISLAHHRLHQGGVTVVNTEMALFEWLATAGAPSFKTLSKLIK
jgi:nicotinamidase-related amidase